MRIAIMSDLHFEFHKDGGRAFIESIDFTEANVLVLAGDVGTSSCLIGALDALCDRVEHVVFTLGNHEFYEKVDPKSLRKKLHAFSDIKPNFHWLNNNAISIGGQRFVGCTLWFPYDPLNVLYYKEMEDFRSIRHFSSWVYDENKKDADYLRSTVSENDIVVTHYLPSEKSVAPRYVGNVYNNFFVHPMDDLIESVQPKAWVHGHTHSNCDYSIGKTRVLCNPFGYHGYDLNRSFIPNLTLEIA